MALHFLSAHASDAQEGDLVALTGEEAHHAATVRRVRAGEHVTVGDGRGVWLEGVCETAGAREVVVRITARTTAEPSRPSITLAQALAKGDRDELAIQAATELGADAIIPWQASRSVSRWDGPKREKGRARWSAIVREAAKQSHRRWVPEVSEPADTATLAALADSDCVLVLDPAGDTALADTPLPTDGGIVLVVGPEGGIADDELARFDAAGAHRVRLGETVLRTSTAGPAALAVVNLRLGRW